MDLKSKLEIAARNKRNYLNAKAAYNARDIDACVAFYAPDHQIMSKSTPRGREHIRRFFHESHANWPDIQIVVQRALAEDDWVMGYSITNATHTNTVLGLDPTNRRIETSFWDLHRFNDEGLMIETWNLMDSLKMMQQMKSD